MVPHPPDTSPDPAPELNHWITQARRIARQRDEFEAEKDGAWAEVERLTRVAAAYNQNAAEAECHVEQLRDARDSAERRIERVERLVDGWEHDGPDDPAIHLLIRRVREALDGTRCEWCGRPSGEHENGCRLGLGPDETGCPGLCGDHHWLDRPESDTRECLICGTEAAG